MEQTLGEAGQNEVDVSEQVYAWNAYLADGITHQQKSLLPLAIASFTRGMNQAISQRDWPGGIKQLCLLRDYISPTGDQQPPVMALEDNSMRQGFTVSILAAVVAAELALGIERSREEDRAGFKQGFVRSLPDRYAEAFFIQDQNADTMTIDMNAADFVKLVDLNLLLISSPRVKSLGISSLPDYQVKEAFRMLTIEFNA